MATKKKKKKRAAPRRKGRGRRLVLFAALLALLAATAVGVLKLKGGDHAPRLAVELSGAVSSLGSAPGQLNSPRGLAVGGDGAIFVADLSNQRIEKFSPEGKLLLAFGQKGEKVEGKDTALGAFNEPSGVAVSPDGDILVADAWNGRIQRFDAKGRYKDVYGGAKYGFYSPRNVAVDRQGLAYVADTGRSRVVVIDPRGAVVKELGQPGSGGGRFNEVFGLAIDSRGEVFAADPGNRRIHKFAAVPDGKFLKSVKVPGWNVNPPFWPQLAVDSRDRVYAGDSGNHQIWVYDSELNLLAVLVSPPGQDIFNNPVGLGFAPDGTLMVADAGRNQILRLRIPEIPAKP